QDRPARCHHQGQANISPMVKTVPSMMTAIISGLTRLVEGACSRYSMTDPPLRDGRQAVVSAARHQERANGGLGDGWPSLTRGVSGGNPRAVPNRLADSVILLPRLDQYSEDSPCPTLRFPSPRGLNGSEPLPRNNGNGDSGNPRSGQRSGCFCSESVCSSGGRINSGASAERPRSGFCKNASKLRMPESGSA